MKIRKKSLILVISSLGIVFLLMVGFPNSSHAQKTIEWKMLASWGIENPSTRVAFVPWVEAVNQRAAGRLKITWFGPEAVPAFEQLKPVRDGAFDGVFTHSAYHLGDVAAAGGLDILQGTGKERRAAGLYKIVDEAYRKKANVTFFAAMCDGLGYQILTKKKVDKADLTGLKIRSSSFYDPLIRGLGGIPVRIPTGETYSALEKGVVDGLGLMAIGAVDYKFYEVVKYIILPRFGEMIVETFLNVDSWNRLPKDLQDLLYNTAIEVMEERGRVLNARMLEDENKELRKQGVEFVTLPPEEAKKYLKIFYDRTWEDVIKRDPEYGPRTKEAAERMVKK